jgi:diacylglycerol kinase family enzyme
MANERPFVNAAGIGMSTRIARRLTKSGKRSLGALSYPVAVIGTMRDHRPFRAIVESDDGRQELRSIQITVGNGVYYGGGTPIAADAAIDDGRLDLYSVQPQPLGRMIGVALAVRRGTQAHLPEGVHTASGTAFSVTTRRPLRVALDGEPRLHTPVQFRVVRRALQVIAPAAPPTIPAD